MKKILLIMSFVLACGGGGSRPQKDIILEIDGIATSEQGEEAFEILEEFHEVKEEGMGELDAEEMSEDIKETTEIQEEVVAPSPSLTCYFITANGIKGDDNNEVSLSLEDEPQDYKQIKGFQVDYGCVTENLENGRDVTLYVMGNKVATEKVEVDPDTGKGTVIFKVIALVHNKDGYEIRTEAYNQAQQKGENIKTVYVDIGKCGVSLLPKNTICVLNDALPEKPGLQMVFTITNPDKTCDTAEILYVVNGVTNKSPTVLLNDAGVAQIEVTVLDQDKEVEGIQVVVSAIISDSKAEGREGEISGIVYTVDLVDPSISITTPAKKLLTLIDDKDGDETNGIQIDVVGTALGTKEGSPLSLLVNGILSYNAIPQAEGAFIFPDVTFTKDGSYNLVVAATDQCGRVGQAVTTIQVKVSKAKYLIVYPPQDAILLAKEDLIKDPQNPYVFETKFEVQGPTDLGPVTIEVECRKKETQVVWYTVGSITLETSPPQGIIKIDASLDVTPSKLGNNVVCKVKDNALNVGTSEEVSFSVGLPAPWLSISEPDPDSIFNKYELSLVLKAGYLSGVFPKIEILDVNQNAVIEYQPPFPLANTGGVYNISLIANGVPIPDGLYVITVDAEDKWGNKISDLQGGHLSVNFILDTTPPTVDIISPKDDLIDPTVYPDQDPEIAGHQITVVVSVLDNSVDGTKVCLGIVGNGEMCKTLQMGDTEAIFSQVTLLPGENHIYAYAVDQGQNNSGKVEKTLILDLEGLRVLITSPGKDTCVVLLPVDIGVTVTDVQGQPIEGAQVKLFMNGLPLSETKLTDQFGWTSFEVNELSETGDIFIATATFGGLYGWSLPRKICHKIGIPEIKFESPKDGEILNLSSTLCAPGSEECITKVVVITSNIEDGSEGILDVDCGNGKQSMSAKVASQKLIFPKVSLGTVGKCQLSVEATDATGQKVSGGPITVTVDRIAPQIAGFLYPPIDHDALDAQFDENPNVPGFQYTVLVKLAGVEAGREVTLKYGSKPTDVVSIKVQETIEDGKFKGLAFPQVTLLDGNVTLEVSTSDLVGNIATFSRTIFVWSQQPSVYIQLPSFVPNISCDANNKCPSGGVCTPFGKCAVPWGIASVKSLMVGVSSIPQNTNNLRICSNSKQVVGNPCSTSGYKQVAITNAPIQGSLKDIDLSSLPDGFHTLIAEVKITDLLPWVSSLSEGDPSKQKRDIYIDKTAPQILSIDVPTDKEPKKILNILEAKSVNPGGGGIYTVQIVGSEPGLINLYLNNSKILDSSPFSGNITVDVAFKEGPNELYGLVTDIVGNLSPIPPQQGVLYYNPTVDTIPPTLSFVNPKGPVIKYGESRDIILKSDAISQQVYVYDEGLEKGSGVVGLDQIVTIPFAQNPILSEGQHNLSAKVSDKAGNQTTAQISTFVDLTLPIINLANPTDKAVIGDQDDAKPDEPGLQISVNFGSPSQDAEKYQIVLETNCISDSLDEWTFIKCGNPNLVATGNMKNPGGMEEPVYVTLVAGITPYIRITVTIFDKVGNVQSSVVRLKIAATCMVSVEGVSPGMWINNGSCPIPGSDCDKVSKKIKVTTSSLCGQIDSITTYIGGNLSQSKIPVGQSAEFIETFADGIKTTFEAKAFSGAQEIASSGVFEINVDLKDPIVKFDSPLANSNAIYSRASDKDLTKDGLQTDLKVSVSDQNLVGGKLTSLTYDYGSGPVALDIPNLVFTEQFTTIELLGITLPDQTQGEVVILVTDVANNVGQSSFKATIDLEPPSPITLEGQIVDRRLPSVSLKWTAVGDNGVIGQASAYDIRYSLFPINNESDFEEACKVTNLAYTQEIPIPNVSGSQEEFLVTGPDPRPQDVMENGKPCRFIIGNSGSATYYLAIRAYDDVGNGSPLGTNSVVSFDLGLRFAMITPTVSSSDAGKSFQRFVYSLGDINNDGLGDIAFGGVNADLFCIVYGHSTGEEKLITDMTIDTLEGPHHLCIQGAQGSKIGSPVVGLGDMNGDGIDDLAVGEGDKNATTNKVKIFFGVNGDKISTQPNITIQGIKYGYGVGLNLGYGGDFNGDGLNDLLICLRGENKGYILLGNNNWDSGTNILIDMKSDTSKNEHKVVTLTMDGNAGFGYSCTFVRDINKDGYDEAGIGTYGDQSHVGEMLVIKGRPITSAITLSYTLDNLKSQGSDDVNAVRLRGEPSTPAGFANWARGQYDLDGDSTGDVLINHQADAGTQSQKTIYGFYGGYLANKWGEIVQVLGSGSVGDGKVSTSPRGFTIKGSYSNPVVIGNFDNDKTVTPSQDIAFVIYSTDFKYGKVFVRFNLKDPNGKWGQGIFPYEGPVLVDPVDPNGVSFGAYSVINAGDFNGDGLPDLFVGTYSSGYTMILY